MPLVWAGTSGYSTESLPSRQDSPDETRLSVFGSLQGGRTFPR